jgi:hypothetical protein
MRQNGTKYGKMWFDVDAFTDAGNMAFLVVN